MGVYIVVLLCSYSYIQLFVSDSDVFVVFI